MALLGYRFNDYLATEGGAAFASGYDVSGTLNRVNVKSSVDYSTLMIGARGFFPVGDKIAIEPHAGMNFWDVEAEVAGGGVTTSASQDGEDPYYGIGVSYAFADSFSARLSYTRLEGEDDELDAISAGIKISF